MRKIISNELDHRVQLLQQQLRHLGLAGAFIMDRVSLLYYFNTIPGGTGFIPATGQPLLFVRRGLERAKGESGFPVQAIRSFRNIEAFLKDKELSHDQIGLEFDRIPVTLFLTLKKYFPNTDFIDVSNALRKQRTIKSDYELSLMRDAGKKAAQSFKKIPELLTRKSNQTELDVMADFEAIMRKKGHQGLIRVHAFNSEVYYGTFASGVSANESIAFDGPVGTSGLYSAAPFLCGTKKIQPNEPIIVDVVFAYQGYIVDQTRIYVMGSLPEKLLDAYNVALQIQNSLVAMMKPGISAGELSETAWRIAAKNKLEKFFMGSDANRVSFVGHGIGLELDEPPVITNKSDFTIEKNMTIALEPKFFFPDLGGVGIENTFCVTSSGGKCLTPMPEEIITI